MSIDREALGAAVAVIVPSGVLLDLTDTGKVANQIEYIADDTSVSAQDTGSSVEYNGVTFKRDWSTDGVFSETARGIELDKGSSIWGNWDKVKNQSGLIRVWLKG